MPPHRSARLLVPKLHLGTRLSAKLHFDAAPGSSARLGKHSFPASAYPSATWVRGSGGARARARDETSEREHAAKGIGSAAVMNHQQTLSIMINEEDHLRMQACRHACDCVSIAHEFRFLMNPPASFQIELIKLADGARVVRVSDAPTAIALTRRLDPARPVIQQKEALSRALHAVLERELNLLAVG